MCCPISEGSKTILFFKIIEPVFWVTQVVIVFNLAFQKIFFGMQLRWLNNLLRYQGFDSKIVMTEKAFQVWRRDLWILMFLNPIVILLISLI